jgi:hypothetical protein
LIWQWDFLPWRKLGWSINFCPVSMNRTKRLTTCGGRKLKTASTRTVLETLNQFHWLTFSQNMVNEWKSGFSTSGSKS